VNPHLNLFVVAHRYDTYARYCRERGWKRNQDARWIEPTGRDLHRIMGTARFFLAVYELDAARGELRAYLQTRGWDPDRWTWTQRPAKPAHLPASDPQEFVLVCHPDTTPHVRASAEEKRLELSAMNTTVIIQDCPDLPAGAVYAFDTNSPTRPPYVLTCPADFGGVL